MSKSTKNVSLPSSSSKNEQPLADSNKVLLRKIAWIELFFDLAFVLVISELTHILSLNTTLDGTLKFVILFFPTWWIWMGSVYYHSRFEVNNLERRIVTFFLMLPCFGFAIYAHHFSDNFTLGFAWSYIIARSIIIGMWLRRIAQEKSLSSLQHILLGGYLLSITLFLSSFFLTAATQPLAWMLVLLCDIITPLFTLKHQSSLPHVNNPHLAERLGLFILLVLGETLLDIVQGIARHRHFSLKVGLEGFLAFLISFMLWWIYFDHIATKTPKASMKWTFLWSYLHFPLVISISGIGASLGNVLIARHHIPTIKISVLLSCSLALGLITLGLIETTLSHTKETFNLKMNVACKFLAALFIFAFGMLSSHLSAFLFLGVLVFFLLLPFTCGIYFKLHHEED